MKTLTLTTTLTLLVALLATMCTLPAQAHWPRTVEENVAIAADPNVIEGLPCTLTLPNGRVLVAYNHDNNGIIYQIINRFGNFEMPALTQLAPGLPQWIDHGIPEVLSDENGGAYIVWSSIGSGPDSLHGIYTQHLDSLGNRLWGESAVRIFPYEASGLSNMPICPDGQGGFFMAKQGGELIDGWSDLWAQRVDATGTLLWGPEGIVVCGIPQCGANIPCIASDLSGGCYVTWVDGRGGVYGQRYNAQGNELWTHNGLYLTPLGLVGLLNLISDGTGGVIMQQTIDGGGYYNRHLRINGNGQIIATRDHLSYGQLGSMILGEQNYFYLGFLYTWGYDVYGQRVDLNLNPHGFGTNGAIICSRPGWGATGDLAFSYGYPYYYFAGGLQIVTGTQVDLITQYLDTLANRKMGDNGTTLSTIPSGTYWYTSVIPIEGDIVAVYQVHYQGYDVWAKRCHADGTLGGPFPLGVTVTPRHPPIQIPAQGGSFSFDIAVADTDSVGGPFDAWIEVTLPGNRTHPITARRHLNMPTGATITKPNLTQFIPASAPAGLYTYRVCAGDDSFKIPWGEGSFTFEKVAGGATVGAQYIVPFWKDEARRSSDSGPAGMTTSSSGMTQPSMSFPQAKRVGNHLPTAAAIAGDSGQAGMTDDMSGWILSGDFFKEGIEVGAHCVRPDDGGVDSEGARSAPLQDTSSDLQLEARPNPFNPDIDISFALSNAQHVELAIYDLRGSKVDVIAEGILPPGLHTYNWNGEGHSAGVYFIRLTSENQSAVKKVTLLK